MPVRKVLTFSVLLLFCLVATAKNKKKAVLPTYVLEARTAWVIVAPQVGRRCGESHGEPAGSR